MIQYYEDGDVAIFDNLVFRRDKKTGYYLNAKTHKRLHVYVWEHFNGKIPRGCEIHHKDFDKSNNEIGNLQMLTKKDFTDTVQFFKVSNADGDSLGEDYAPLSEYKNGGESWLKELAGNLIYEPIRTEAVFFTGEAVAYKGAAAFYTDASISFRCCAYPED